MNMTTNVGDIDRIFRIVLGALLIILTFTPVIGWWGLIGIVLLATGILRFCPAYSLIGINTCKTEGSDESADKQFMPRSGNAPRFRGVFLWALLLLGLLPAQLQAGLSGELPGQIDEASGLTRSIQHEGLYWTHNDNINIPGSNCNGPPILFAVQADGKLISEVTLANTCKRDWEAITHAYWNGKPVLLVGDIGDNREIYPEYRILLVEEPKQLHSSMTVPVLGQIRFRYPDRSYDAEAMAYDREAERILIMTKRREKPMLYELPLEPTGDRIIEAVPVLELAGFKHSDPITQLLNPRIGPYAHQPTGMDISPDQREIAILTYSTVYRFSREEGEPWEQALKRQPRSISLPQLAQWEGITYAADGRSLIVVRDCEGQNILVLPLQD